MLHLEKILQALVHSLCIFNYFYLVFEFLFIQFYKINEQQSGFSRRTKKWEWEKFDIKEVKF